MIGRIQITRHEAVPKCGSYEVRFLTAARANSSIGKTFPAGVSSQTRPTAFRLKDAKAFARAERDRT